MTIVKKNLFLSFLKEDSSKGSILEVLGQVWTRKVFVKWDILLRLLCLNNRGLKQIRTKFNPKDQQSN